MRRNGLFLVLSACVLASAGLSWGQASTSAPADGLAPRHTDLRNGFSLCPPSGTERQRVTSASQIVSWVSRDASTNAINWTLGVEKIPLKEKVTLKTLGPEIVESLAKSEGLKADYTRSGKLGEKETFEFAGPVVVGKGQLWKRQLWVQQTPTSCLVVAISGPAAAKEKLDTLFTAVIGTLELSDPAKFEQILKANLQAGKDLLAGATQEKIKGLVRSEPQYFILKYQGKTVGYTVQREHAITTPWPGVSVTSQTVLDLQGHRVLTRELAVSLDRTKESWTESLKVDNQPPDVEEGSFANGEITCSLKFAGEKPATSKSKSPPEYAPKALGLLLPRLIPQDKAGSYAVFTYNAAKIMFETRTLVADGKTTLALGDKTVDCFRLTDQSGLEAQPASLYLDASGNVLQMQTTEGLTMQSTTEAEVLKAFPKAKP